MSNAAAVTAADENKKSTPDDFPTFVELGLPEPVVRILAKRGIVTPFPIQASTIPDALLGLDILGRGRTGSGKTLSFGLPLLARLADGQSSARKPRGLVLVPTRELAVQVSEALEPYGSVLGLRLKVVCGGTSMQKQIDALRNGVDILVATPGRLRDLIERRVCELSVVEIAVLDEADQMADLGFLPEVSELLDLVPTGGQRMLFSATLDRGVDTLVDRYLQSPVLHSVDPAAGAVVTMEHHALVVQPREKDLIAAAIAARPGRAIAFVRTQLGAERVAGELGAAGLRVQALHGGMTQQARSKTLADFKDGRIPVLVATDVAARGIHVDDIDVVLHIDPAADHKDYLHRAGRTARAGRSGTVVTLVLPHQRRSVFRMLELAGVQVRQHQVRGVFAADLSAIVGAESVTGLRAELAAARIREAEANVIALTRQLEAAKHEVEARTAEVAELRRVAAAEASGEMPVRGERARHDRPSRDGASPERFGSGDRPRRKSKRGDGAARESGYRRTGVTRRDGRSGSSVSRDGGKSFEGRERGGALVGRRGSGAPGEHGGKSGRVRDGKVAGHRGKRDFGTGAGLGKKANGRKARAAIRHSR